jgi:hypothetical protein
MDASGQTVRKYVLSKRATWLASECRKVKPRDGLPLTQYIIHFNADFLGCDTVWSSRCIVASVVVVVSVLTTGPKGRGYKPGRGDGFLRTIKIRSTPSSRMGSKAGGPMS